MASTGIAYYKEKYRIMQKLTSNFVSVSNLILHFNEVNNESSKFGLTCLSKCGKYERTKCNTKLTNTSHVKSFSKEEIAVLF